jgi:hypothetical protein
MMRDLRNGLALGTAETANAGDPVQLVGNPEVIHSRV